MNVISYIILTDKQFISQLEKAVILSTRKDGDGAHGSIRYLIQKTDEILKRIFLPLGKEFINVLNTPVLVSQGSDHISKIFDNMWAFARQNPYYNVYLGFYRHNRGNAGRTQEGFGIAVIPAELRISFHINREYSLYDDTEHLVKDIGHEIGHLFGLDDHKGQQSLEQRNCIMSYSNDDAVTFCEPCRKQIINMDWYQ